MELTEDKEVKANVLKTETKRQTIIFLYIVKPLRMVGVLLNSYKMHDTF